MSKKFYNTFLLCSTVFFLFADQNLLAPNLSAIAKEFGFTDAQKNQMLGGNIALGFFLVGGVAALMVGYLTDTVNRFQLFGVVVICGESACLGTYFIRTYIQLLLCRIATGVAIGGKIKY
jgi:MFS family permease